MWGRRGGGGVAVILIMYIYHALIDVLSAHMVHSDGRDEPYSPHGTQ